MLCIVHHRNLSLSRVAFKKNHPPVSRKTPSTRQTRLNVNPQECSDTNVYVVWYIVISRVDITFSDRLTAASLARVPGVLPVVAFRNGSVLCIMSSSNNGHKVSYKRCQNVVIIIAVSQSHAAVAFSRASPPRASRATVQTPRERSFTDANPSPARIFTALALSFARVRAIARAPSHAPLSRAPHGRVESSRCAAAATEDRHSDARRRASRRRRDHAVRAITVRAKARAHLPVSYTHLTLPTKA